MIVKVQRSLVSSDERSRVLIYNERRTILIEVEATDETTKFFEKDEAKIFCHAVVHGKDDIVLTRRAPWKDW